ncbi:ABC transporter permease [Streptomyces eurythermus]
MRLDRLAVIGGNEWRMLWKDQAVVMLLIVTPAVMMGIMADGLAPVVRESFDAGASMSGADFAVPGFTVMFAFFMTGFMGNGFFLERGWGTWQRLRASSARSAEVLLGKTAPYAAVSTLQILLLLAFGWLVLDLHLRGSVAGLVLMIVAVVAVIMAIALFLVAHCGSSQQISALTNLVGIVGGVIGGAFLPVDSLPGWTQAVAYVTPQYWAVDGLSGVLGAGDGLADVVPNAAVLLGAAVVLIALSARRLSLTEQERVAA